MTNLKPDWKDAPYWAEWLARDKNGDWYWYEFEPVDFTCDDKWNCRAGRAEIAHDSAREDWKETKQSRQ